MYTAYGWLKKKRYVNGEQLNSKFHDNLFLKMTLICILTETDLPYFLALNNLTSIMCIRIIFVKKKSYVHRAQTEL